MGPLSSKVIRLIRPLHGKTPLKIKKVILNEKFNKCQVIYPWIPGIFVTWSEVYQAAARKMGKLRLYGQDRGHGGVYEAVGDDADDKSRYGAGINNEPQCK